MDNQNLEKQTENEKEVSIIDIFNYIIIGIKKVFSSFYNLICNFIQYIKKNKILYGISFILIFCLCFLYYLVRPQINVATGTIYFYGTTPDVVGDAVSSINKYKEDQLYYQKENFCLTDSIFCDINTIKTEFISPAFLSPENTVSISSKDTSKKIYTDRLSIIMDIKGRHRSEDIEQSISNYLNNYPILKDQFNTYVSSLKYNLDVCERELIRIDSLARKSYESNEKESQLVFENSGLFLGTKQKQLFYNDLLNLSERRINLNKKINDAKKPVLFSSGIIITPKPYDNIKLLFIYPLFLGFILGLFFDLFILNKKNKRSKIEKE